MLPPCLLTDCEETSAGFVCVNENAGGFTIIMMPVCEAHGQQMRSESFTMQFQGEDDPLIKFGKDDHADSILTYQAIGDDTNTD